MEIGEILAAVGSVAAALGLLVTFARLVLNRVRPSRTIDVKVPDLKNVMCDIYLTGTDARWKGHPYWKYKQSRPGVFRVKARMRREQRFKNFVLSALDDRFVVGEALKTAHYLVTGTGDASPGDPTKWRTWFLLPPGSRFPVTEQGDKSNHIWN